MKRQPILPAFLCIFLFLFALPAAAQEFVTVEAEGMAAVENGNVERARKEAKGQLYRDALEKGIGAYVQGVTEMKDFQVVRDQVFSQSQGIVTKTDILKEWTDSDGIFHITASCTVSTKTLDGVLGPAVISALGNPRVLVLVDEVVEGERQFLSTAEGAVLRAFEKAGYLMVDPTQAEAIQKGELEAAKASGDAALLSDVAKKFRSDVLIYGKAQAASYTKQKISGVTLYGVRSQLQLKAILAATAYGMGTEMAEHKDKGTSPGDGAVKGFSVLGPDLAKELVHKVAYALVSGTAGGIPGRTFRVTVANLSFGEARTLRESMEKAPGVTGAYQRSYGNKSLEMDVVTEKSAEETAAFLETLGVEITGLTAGTVEGKKTP